jgi:hypothetical protein
MMRSRINRWAFFAAVLLLALAPAALAQNPTGDIRGTVTDADGGALPGVVVTATSPNLQGSRTAVTSQNGSYRLALLPPGQYTVTFELEGFGTATSDVKVSAALANGVDATLNLAAVSEEIVVTGESGQISESTTGASSYGQDEVEKLPLQRDLDDTVALAPGVHETGPSENISISGALSYENLWTLNGVVISENLRGQELPLFIEDAIQETTIQTSGISAEFGRFGGGVVNAITKSGGNELSGSFRVNFVNDDWVSRTPLSPERIDDRNQIYEATLGGYLWKDHLWFFAAGRDQEEAASFALPLTNIGYLETISQTRLDGKLTANIADRHTLVGQYLEIEQEGTNDSFSNNIDPDGLTDRSDPQKIFSANYTGILSPSFFVEAQYSEREFQISVGGGARSRDLINGTLLRSGDGRFRYHTPTFCGVCETEERNNENLLLKSSYLFSTERLGTHDLAFGYDTFSDIRFAINHQTGSDFTVWDSTLVIQGDEIFPVFYPYGNTAGATPVDIGWFAIFNQDQARPNDFTTNSYYVNDRWQLDENWSFNLGLRYDENDGRDQGGAKVADDSKLSPRLGATWDIKGDGDLVLHGSYGTYVAALANSIGDQASSGGAVGQFVFGYEGPEVNTTCGQPGGTCLSSEEALEILFDWYLSNGGPTSLDDNLNFPTLNGVLWPGLTNVVPDTLVSQSTDEVTIGASKRLGNRGLLRADVVYREMEDFYSNSRVPNRWVDVPFIGPQDLIEVGNGGDDILEREYLGLHLQSRYRLTEKLVVAGNWTLSELTGNYEGETVASGPSAGFTGTSVGPGQYREYFDPSWAYPIGNLSSDQRHKVRAWAIYDVIENDHHNLSLSLLQSFFSGRRYSAIGGLANNYTGIIANPGYRRAVQPGDIDYFFSERGAFSFDDITSTDLSINYSFLWDAFGRQVEVYLQPEVLNLFDEEGVVLGDTRIRTFAESNLNGACPQSGHPLGRCIAFNPFNETPVEGVHWAKFATFGEPIAESQYQDPRTFRFSVGFRF